MEDLSKKHGGITFETRRRPDGDPYPWEATIHQRDCAWLGETEAEAIGNMVNGIAMLAADGMIDPRRPDEPGPISRDNPVQQCVELLERKLKLLVAESADATGKADADPSAVHDENRRRLQEARRTIGNVGTALAALCRVESN